MSDRVLRDLTAEINEAHEAARASAADAAGHVLSYIAALSEVALPGAAGRTVIGLGDLAGSSAVFGSVNESL